jgi:enoyl-CoA hydratase/carnithine racemase
VSGVEAASIGLVLKALPTAEVLPAAYALAEQLGAASPIALRTATRTLRSQLADGLESALWREADAQAQCYASADMVEGIGAIVEKRAPAFQQVEGYAA